MMQDDDRVLQLPTIDNYKLDQKCKIKIIYIFSID